MRAYIKKLQMKEESKRKQIFTGAMVLSMLFVGVVWIYGLGIRFGDPSIKTQTKEDIKPFKLFSNSLNSVYDNVSASVGKVETKEVKEEDKENQIDLIPVEYSNQEQ